MKNALRTSIHRGHCLCQNNLLLSSPKWNTALPCWWPSTCIFSNLLLTICIPHICAGYHAHPNENILHVNVFQPPKAESLNGLLLGYRIYYRELDYDAGSATESKAVKNPSALRAELTRKPVFWMFIVSPNVFRPDAICTPTYGKNAPLCPKCWG